MDPYGTAALEADCVLQSETVDGNVTGRILAVRSMLATHSEFFKRLFKDDAGTRVTPFYLDVSDPYSLFVIERVVPLARAPRRKGRFLRCYRLVIDPSWPFDETDVVDCVRACMKRELVQPYFPYEPNGRQTLNCSKRLKLLNAALYLGTLSTIGDRLLEPRGLNEVFDPSMGSSEDFLFSLFCDIFHALDHPTLKGTFVWQTAAPFVSRIKRNQVLGDRIRRALTFYRDHHPDIPFHWTLMRPGTHCFVSSKWVCFTYNRADAFCSDVYVHDERNGEENFHVRTKHFSSFDFFADEMGLCLCGDQYDLYASYALQNEQWIRLDATPTDVCFRPLFYHFVFLYRASSNLNFLNERSFSALLRRMKKMESVRQPSPFYRI